MTRSRARIGFSLILAACAVAPAARRALADDTRHETPTERVLRKLPTDPTVLINVQSGVMPASPDIVNLGKRATKALERCLSDNTDASIRVECAEALTDIGDRRALPTLRAALEDWEEPVRYHVVWALESMPDPTSYDGLAKIYQRKDESERIKEEALDALGALGSHAAVRFLRHELHRVPAKGKPDRRAIAFSALWQSRSLMARRTLIADTIHALRSGEESLVYVGVMAAAELRERALSGSLIPLIDNSNVEVRNKAVYALGKIGDPTATRALLVHLPKVREPRMLNNIAFALERLQKKKFYAAINKLAQHKQAIVRLNAAFVIGDVRRPEGLPILERTAGDASDLVRSSSLAAIGKLDTPKAVPAAEKYIDDPNWSIRQEAVYAVNELSHGKRANLVYSKLYAAKLPRIGGREIRRRAAIELGKLGDRRVKGYLVSCYESHNCSLKDVDDFFEKSRSAKLDSRLLLGWAQGRYELTRLLGGRKPAGASSLAESNFAQGVSLHYLVQLRQSADLLGYVGSPSVRTALDAELGDKLTWTRLHVAIAAARLGDKKAAQRVLAELDNAPAAWLPRIARLLARGDQSAFRSAFRSELERRARKGADLDLSMAAAAVLLAWYPEKAFFRFLDALASASPRRQELARRYVERARDKKVTWVMRRALARETRPFVRDQLRVLLDDRT